jgi:hypothetical protein
LSRRFPNPVPHGTRVPYWALIDVTVRKQVFFFGNVLTTKSRLRILGTLSNRILSVVRIIFLLSIFPLPASHWFLGTIEAGPGTILGHPIRFVSASKDHPLDAGPQSIDSDIPPTNSPTWKSSLNAYATAVVMVCRLAVLLIICAAIFFYLQRRRPRVQCPTSVGDDAHHPQWKSLFDKGSLDTSTLAGTLTTLTKPSVRVFCALRCACLRAAFELPGSD